MILSVSHCLSLSVFLAVSLPLCLSLAVSRCLSLLIAVCLSCRLSLILSPLSDFPFVSRCLSLPISLAVCLPVCLSDWQQVVSVAVLDCAQEENFDVCKEFGIKFYPTFKVRHLTVPPPYGESDRVHSGVHTRYSCSNFIALLLCSIFTLTVPRQNEGRPTEVRHAFLTCLTLPVPHFLSHLSVCLSFSRCRQRDPVSETADGEHPAEPHQTGLARPLSSTGTVQVTEPV